MLHVVICEANNYNPGSFSNNPIKKILGPLSCHPSLDCYYEIHTAKKKKRTLEEIWNWYSKWKRISKMRKYPQSGIRVFVELPRPCMPCRQLKDSIYKKKKKKTWPTVHEGFPFKTKQASSPPITVLASVQFWLQVHVWNAGATGTERKFHCPTTHLIPRVRHKFS